MAKTIQLIKGMVELILNLSAFSQQVADKIAQQDRVRTDLRGYKMP